MASITALGLTVVPGSTHTNPTQSAGPVSGPAQPTPASAPMPAVPVPDVSVPAVSVPAGPLSAASALAGPVPAVPAAGGLASGGPVSASAQIGSGGRAERPTVPAHMLPHRTPVQLLTIARESLTEAAHTTPDGLRYATAHMAALRAAAALLAARARPSVRPSRRTKATSVWSLLAMVAPEFSDWAGYFALGAGKRAAAEAGIPQVVSAREADDLLRAAEQFVAVAESSLGLSYQPKLAA